MADFYEVKKVAYNNLVGVCGTEEERGLNEECECGGKHQWFMFPQWSEAVKEGGKAYCMCINCHQHSHL